METIFDPLGLIAGTWNALGPDGFITYVGALVACGIVALAHLLVLALVVVPVLGAVSLLGRRVAGTPKAPASEDAGA